MAWRHRGNVAQPAVETVRHAHCLRCIKTAHHEAPTSYSVAADTTSSLLVTFIEADFDGNNVKTADAQTTFRVDTSGTLQFVSLKVTGFVVNGNERADLTFQTP